MAAAVVVLLRRGQAAVQVAAVDLTKPLGVLAILLLEVRHKEMQGEAQEGQVIMVLAVAVDQEVLEPTEQQRQAATVVLEQVILFLDRH
jgi:hypothetical protein